MAWARISGLLLAAVACSPAPARTVARAPIADPAGSVSHFLDAKSERVRSHSLDFPIELTLPGKASWRIADGPTWFEAKQQESASEFAFRTWRAERLVRRSDCASQARLARVAIPVFHDEAIVERRPFAAPADFDSELVVGVEPDAVGVSGYAIVFGASVGRCYAAVFTTAVTGAGSEAEVAARLGNAVDRVLGSVRTRSVDERVLHRRLVVSPKAASD